VPYLSSMKLTFPQHLTLITLIALSYFHIDMPVALWVEANIRSYSSFKLYTSNIPSMLLMLVIVISSISWAAYIYLRLQRVANRHRDFFLVLGTALPLAYLAKSLLKWCFGRLETRLWLVKPDQYGMHWFNGVNGYDAFPSGHMLVITQLFLAIWFFYPKLRLVNFLAWIALAFALIVTNYHFVADVIAGIYVAIWLYGFCVKALIKHSPVNTN